VAAGGRVLNSQHDFSPAFDDKSSSSEEEQLGVGHAEVHHFLKGIGSSCWRF
jgi:hypothetical protein